MEQRIAKLAKQFDAIDASLRELQQALKKVSAAATSGTAAPSASTRSRAAVDPASITALQPCAQDTPEVAAVRRWCLENGLYSAVFKWVPSDYYSHTLQWRRDVLDAATIAHLCKTIVLENTHCVNTDCSDKANSRYYLAVYQYVEKFDAEMIMRVIKEMNTGLGKKKFNFRLADEEKAKELTGFTHGAVVPFGTTQPVPVVLSASVMKLTPAYIFLGGGHVDCKVRVDVDEFVERLQPIVAPITVPLSTEELEQIAD